ncbi:uncharacterized protein LOC126366438 [Pectinophora gossypiella]|uniref:uncharacterized protein LOC126366438 n=1 Tax=Pectinophora gossypiella TaxID=13191 RepID=UPI00214F0B03|nr:uncharacterized protein LOC126366438 [Pectinophora gossypiella]
MPITEAPCMELGSAPQTPSAVPSPSPSEISSASSPEPQNIRAPPLFRVLAMPPPDPEQPPGQEELERRLPGYRRIVIPRELTLIELLKQSSGATTDEEVLRIREAKLRVVAERVGLRRLHVLAPRIRSLTLDGSALSSLRDLGTELVHLKILSVNRCGLTSLDGIWGLSALRELHAAGNRLQDLQPLAALQKLHTLNLADNPIADTSRLWMLGVCGALRRLTLKGTQAADDPDYRQNVASALSMLTYLDDRSLQDDSEDEIVEQDAQSSSSDSEADDDPSILLGERPSANPEPAPSTSCEAFLQEQEEPDDYYEKLKALEAMEESVNKLPKLHRRRRPATTEGAGVRPPRVELPRRPKTAQERPNIDAPTRLQILNTLMDEEWRCSGSKLTSHGAVCGNLAQALRRPTPTYRCSRDKQAHKEMIETGVEIVTRALAEEIPRAPHLDDWNRFKKLTGIDIDIDFTQRPKAGDPVSAIERLERIEKETKERLSNPDQFVDDIDPEDCTRFRRAMTVVGDYELWKMENIDNIQDTRNDVNSFFADLNIFPTAEDSLTD